MRKKMEDQDATTKERNGVMLHSVQQNFKKWKEGLGKHGDR